MRTLIKNGTCVTASDTFAGIRPADVPGFIAAQLVGAILGVVLFRLLAEPREAA